MMQNFGIRFTWLLGLSTVTAFWRMPCDNVLIAERLDPIVSPNAISSHVHNVAGGSNFSPDSDYESLRNSTCTSCPIKEDLSAYWTPQLYYQYENGSFQSVPNGGLTVYYLQRPGSDTDRIMAFPEGFRMISGNPSLRTYDATSRAQQAVDYVCLNAASGSYSSNSFPTTDCPDGMRLQLVFPSCWDGVHLDSADHKSHMAFPTEVAAGQCDDPKFPVRLITIFFEVFYDVTQFRNMWYNNSTPFVLANGDPTGYSLHGDFINGWDVAVLQNATDNCNNLSGEMEDCQAFTVSHPATPRLQCHKSPSVDEVVLDVVLAKLPGCNPVTTVAVSKAPVCPNDLLPTLFQNSTGYSGLIVPAGYATLTGEARPQILSSSGSWAYQGCYQDATLRVLPVKANIAITNMTVEACISQCGTQNLAYAGLEYGQECWCGNSLNAPLLTDQSCSMLCTGNNADYCGGGLALLVYSKASKASSAQTPLSSKQVAQSRPASSSVINGLPNLTPTGSLSRSVHVSSTTIHSTTTGSAKSSATGFAATFLSSSSMLAKLTSSARSVSLAAKSSTSLSTVLLSVTKSSTLATTTSRGQDRPGFNIVVVAVHTSSAIPSSSLSHGRPGFIVPAHVAQSGATPSALNAPVNGRPGFVIKSPT